MWPQSFRTASIITSMMPTFTGRIRPIGPSKNATFSNSFASCAQVHQDLVRPMQRAIAVFLISLVTLCGPARGEIYYPEGGVRPSKGKVDIELIRLVTDQDVIERNISVHTLADFIKRAEQSVTRSVPPDAPPFRLHALVTLSPRGRPEFHLRYNQKSLPHAMLQKIYDGLRKLPEIHPKTESISFEIDFVIKAKA